jgi:hypothetical protein
MAVYLTTNRGILLFARGAVFGALCADGSCGYVGTTGVFSAYVSGVEFGMEDYRLVVYHEVGCIPQERLLGRRFFLFSFLVAWLHNLVFNKPFYRSQILMID